MREAGAGEPRVIDSKCEIAFAGYQEDPSTLTTHKHRKGLGDAPVSAHTEPICRPTCSTHPNWGVSEGSVRGKTGDLRLLTNQERNRRACPVTVAIMTLSDPFVLLVQHTPPDLSDTPDISLTVRTNFVT